jgi:hypothetical protein
MGLEWARPGMANAFHGIGTSWVRIGDIGWWRIEPSQPENGVHCYNWAPVDRVVREYQMAGFTNIQLVLSSLSSWGSTEEPKYSPESSSMPKEEHWEDFEKFIYNLVERYDGDGRRDFPGLVAPVHHLQVEPEAYHMGFWQGTVDEYGRLLRTVYRIAKTANEDCRIILTGINLGDLNDDSPARALVDARFDRADQSIKRARRFMERCLTFHDSFDIVDFHYHFDYKGAYGTVGWIRRQMDRHGYSKPIWAGEATGAPHFESPFVPRFSRFEGNRLFGILKDAKHPRHAELVAWYEREQVVGLVKKTIVAMHLGLEGIVFGNLTDWPAYWGGRGFLFQGFLREDGSKRPVYHTYRFLQERLARVLRVVRLPTDPNVFAYQLEEKEEMVLIAWCDEGVEAFTLPSMHERVRTFPVTSVSESGPVDPRTLDATQDDIIISLDTVPLVVEPEPCD